MARKAAAPALKLVNGRGEGLDSGGRPVKPTPGFVRLPPEPPDILWGDALEEWNRVVPELQRLQITKLIDAASLTAYCLAWQRLCQAQRVIDEEGLLHSNSQGRTRHPAVAIVEAASKELRGWASEFGLTPSAENRVAKAEADDGETNPFAG
jgi:P27 family predicted phage terminase small subunit